MQMSLEVPKPPNESLAVDFITTEIERRLRELRCPAHHRGPEEVVSERAGHWFRWRFSGICCEALAAEIRLMFADLDDAVQQRFAPPV